MGGSYSACSTDFKIIAILLAKESGKQGLVVTVVHLPQAVAAKYHPPERQLHPDKPLELPLAPGREGGSSGEYKPLAGTRWPLAW